MSKPPEAVVLQQSFDMAAKKLPATIKPLPAARRTRKGAVRTVLTASKLLEMYKDPRATLLEVTNKATEELAKELGCTLLEARQEQRLSAQVVLPYVSQKLPVQIDMQHSRAIVLNIVDDRQYSELVELASEPDEMAIEAQLVAPKQHPT